MKIRRVLLLMVATMPLGMLFGNPLIIASLIGVAGGVLGGLLGGSDNAEQAAAEQLAFAKMMYDDYKQTYGPLEATILKELNAPVEESPTFRRAIAQVEQQYGTVDAMLRRRGVIGAPQGQGIDQARRSGAAYRANDARANILATLDTARTGQQLQALQVGKGGSQAEANLSNVYSQRTQYAAQNAAQGAAGWGQTAGNLAQLYMMYNAGTTGGQTPGAAVTAGSLDDRINIPSTLLPNKPTPRGSPDYFGIPS